VPRFPRDPESVTAAWLGEVLGADVHGFRLEQIGVASTRSWASAVRWVTPTICVHRGDRDAVGFDGEKYAWTRIYAAEVRDGLLASICEFELEYEDEAFTYAEQLTADG
jgi:hypothetical protein